MASLRAIAAERGLSAARIMVAAEVLKERFGIAGVDLPTQGRDPLLVWARQSEAIADLLEQVVAATATAPEREYRTMAEDDEALMHEYMQGATEADDARTGPRLTLDIDLPDADEVDARELVGAVETAVSMTGVYTSNMKRVGDKLETFSDISPKRGRGRKAG